MSLNAQQREVLLKQINPNRVKHKDGASNLEAWDIRRYLCRIFGIAGWSAEVVDMRLMYESTCMIGVKSKNPRPGYEVAYLCTMRLTIHATGAAYVESAIGSQKMGENNRGDVHDFAVKTAESQALKRCAVNLGDQFGLSLYNDGKTEPVVNVDLSRSDGEVTDAEDATDQDEVVEADIPPEPDDTWTKPDESDTPAISDTADPTEDIPPMDPSWLWEQIVAAGSQTNAKARRTQIAKLSLKVGQLGLAQVTPEGQTMTFAALIDMAATRGK